jgi:hypothetical protein
MREERGKVETLKYIFGNGNEMWRELYENTK